MNYGLKCLKYTVSDICCGCASFSQADEFFQIRRLYTILGSSIFYKVWIKLLRAPYMDTCLYKIYIIINKYGLNIFLVLISFRLIQVNVN